MHATDPIGIFDSGLGGLTVVRALARALPQENLLYFADTAHVPYGDKSPERIHQYTMESSAHLHKRGIKMLIIACNTACAIALSAVRASLPIPVIGIIEHAIPALDSSAKRVAILGTRATIASDALQCALNARAPRVKPVPIACPLFVSLVERGLVQHEMCDLVARAYLSGARVDSALLACSHFPLLHQHIQRAIGDGVSLIDPAPYCAEEAKCLLVRLGLCHPQSHRGTLTCCVSGDSARFHRLSEALLPK